MQWFRIDDRLIHGQIIESWLPFLRVSDLIVANDALAGDMLQQEIMSLAVPSSIQAHFVTLEQFQPCFSKFAENCLVLFAQCQDALHVYRTSCAFDVLNIGNIHEESDKKRISPSIALSNQEQDILKELQGLGVVLDFRCVPNDLKAVLF